MSGVRVIGAVIAIIGVVLLAFGFNATHSLADRASETFIGRYTHETMVYLIVGAAALIGGGLVALTGRR